LSQEVYKINKEGKSPYFHVKCQYCAQFVMFDGMIANLEGTHLKESVESTPPANRHSHHPTTHRGALLGGERLTVPASSSRLSELELRSWEKEEGGRGELQCKSRGGWSRVRTRQKRISRLHSSHLFEQQGLAMTPQANKMYCVIFITGC